MSFLETLLLGALAGGTIFLGLPIARMRILGERQRVALAMFSVGILVFLLVDVLGHGFEISEHAVSAYHDGNGSFGRALLLALLFTGGFALGSAGLGYVERRARSVAPGNPPIAGAAAAPATPPIAGGAVDTADGATVAMAAQEQEARERALRTALIVAGAIGIHNFAEGLAIGVSASTGEIGLATVLIIGFALHNSTEGFGIVGPLGSVQPSWRWILLAGLIGGGPTLVGSIVGYQVSSATLELAFYAVAGGAILYVIGEIWHGMRRFGHRELGMAWLALGFAAGVITDLIVAYGGG
jgi:zinc transporter, ZIP family